MNDRTIASTWSEAPADGWKPALSADGIHLWLADLDRPPKSLAQLTATLTADERERAARFHFPVHRDRFVVGRGLLRELLGAYLNRPAKVLRFACGPRGKPLLAGEDADAGLRFNLSHSGERALYAIARREVGVDLECLNRVVNDAAVAERVCTPREWAAFQALPAERFREAFLAAGPGRKQSPRRWATVWPAVCETWRFVSRTIGCRMVGSVCGMPRAGNGAC